MREIISEEIRMSSEVYVMDERGITLAASNWDREDSFVGSNFSFRPYFQQAMAGQEGFYFALGLNTGIRGLYFSAPVRANERVMGAEAAYFECLHELKLIVDLLYEGGLDKMYEFISDTASYGDLVSGPRILDDSVKQRMQEVLAEIQDGTFAKQWMEEYANGSEGYQAMLKQRREHPIEKVGRSLRERMSWLGKKAKAQKAA